MRACDVMMTPVTTVSPDMTVQEAAKILVKERISGAPVIDSFGRLVGMLSEGDLIRRVELDTEDSGYRSWWLGLFFSNRDAADYVKSHGHVVRDVMTEEVVTVEETTSLKAIAKTLETRRIKRVPVVRSGQLVGIVSRANLVQALASAPHEAHKAVASSDAEIREALMKELSGHSWSLAGRNVIVHEGVVHLWGSIWSTDQLRAMRIAAEGISGVKGVEDHTVSEPVMSGM
jgi:CBS domain-containing protein